MLQTFRGFSAFLEQKQPRQKQQKNTKRPDIHQYYGFLSKKHKKADKCTFEI